MKSRNDLISGDLEVGVAVEKTALSKSLTQRRKKPSSSARFAAAADMVVATLKFNFFYQRRTIIQQTALLLLFMVGAIIDPLLFYIPTINKGAKCMKSDWKLGIFAISSRTLVDAVHFVLWFFHFKKKWKSRRFKSSAPGNTNLSPFVSMAIIMTLEILSILPLPQLVAVAFLIKKHILSSSPMMLLFKCVVLFQLIVRAFRVNPSFQEVTRNSITLIKSRFWIGAGFNLILFVIASHVLGAFWYLLSVGRTMDCWKSACRSRGGCNIDSLYCGGPADNKSYLDVYCPIRPATNSSSFDFGIYLSALESNIVGSISFPLKLSYCFWWGLRNMSSLGQNLATSPYVWEICFSICISILGLILFSLFIGNMQAYFQYRTNEDLMNMKGKMDKIIKKQRDLSNWELFQWLPPRLKELVISCVEDNWLETKEVDLRSTLDYLPKGLSNQIKTIISSKVQENVKLFQFFDKRAVETIMNGPNPKAFAEGTLVFKKDQPIDRMVFILNGRLTKQAGSDGSKDQELRLWDYCGEDLLKEIANGSTTTRPPSTADIKASGKVEALVLDAKDLEFLVNQSRDAIERVKQFLEGSKEKAVTKPTAMTKSASFKDNRDGSVLSYEESINLLRELQKGLASCQP